MNWEKKILGDIINLKRGYDLPSQKRKFGNVPIISSSGITDFHIEPAKSGEGVVTGRYGTLGQLFYINGDYWPLNTTLYVQDFKGNFPKFIYYFLKTLNIEKFNAASAVPGLDRNVLHKIDVNLPPLSIQRKIASILSTYDDMIENNLKRIKLLEEKAFLIYKTEFDFFKPSNENNKLPANWQVKRADEIFKISIGKTPPREQEEWFNDIDSGVKWVSIKDINNSTIFIFDTNETVTESAVDKFNMNIAKANTVILSFKLTVGKVAITTENMVTNEAIAHFNIVNENKMSPEFIYFYLKNFPYDSLGSTSSIGTAINSKIVKLMPILIPTEKVIKEFERKVKYDFLLIQNLLKQNAHLRQARDILLPKLMSGEIEV
jgi:type I restriction enzyme, S subunit